MARLSEQYQVGCVVWSKHTRWPWWPSKVEEVGLPGGGGENETITIKCFRTEDQYKWNDCAKTRKLLKPFVHDGVEDFVTKEKKSCCSRKRTYADYCEAISQAVDYTREHTGDPSFSLGIDPFADVSTLSQKKTTPKQGDLSLNSCTNTLTRKNNSSRSSASSTSRKRQKVSSVSPTSKKGHNNQAVNATAASPSLVGDSRDTTSDDIKSSNRKRSRDPVASHGNDTASSEAGVKRQRANSDGSPYGSVEEEERGIEAIPRKLNFNDDDPERKLSAEEDSSYLKSHSSPVAKAEQKPSSPCGASLTNGHTDRLSSAHDRKDSSVHVSEVSDKVKAVNEKEKETRTEWAETAMPPIRNNDDDASTKDSETKESSCFLDSDDDSMPAFDCSVTEELKVRELKSNSIIWVKYGSKYPYWPALVTDVTQKKKTSGRDYVARVLFFGYDEKYTTPIRDKKKIAPFATKRREEFLEEGRNSSYQVQFNQAVEEAQTCMDYRLIPDNTTSTPRKLFDKVAKLRPKEYTRKQYAQPVWTRLEDDGAEREKEPSAEEGEKKEDDFLTGRHRLPFCEDSDEEANIELEDSEDEEENSVYGYDSVMKEVNLLRPVLVDITQGKVPSEFHRMFVEGTRKEQSQLKVAPKAGPLTQWSTSKLTTLATKLKEICDEASNGKLLLSYAYSVLLPEFTTRIIMKFEGVSEDEALKKLDHKKI